MISLGNSSSSFVFGIDRYPRRVFHVHAVLLCDPGTPSAISTLFRTSVTFKSNSFESSIGSSKVGLLSKEESLCLL